MLSILATGAVLTFLIPMLPRRIAPARFWMALVTPVYALAYLLRHLPAVRDGAALEQRWRWLPDLAGDLSLRLDGSGMVFGLLISGMGLLVAVYASGYLAGHPLLARFYSQLTLFMTAMLGVAWSDNLFVLFIFWELTSISSYLLIGFNHDDGASRKSALQALLVTAGGGLALLAGLVLLGIAGGSFDFSALNTRAAQIAESPLVNAAVILILIGAFTKSAQFPFHFWLPNAMAAPTPVSAYLHSATMVKAGIFLIARLSPALGGMPAWEWLVPAVGLTTIAAGALLALGQTDLKRLLAYTTIAALGMITFLLGLGTPLAVKAAWVFLVGHSLYKGALFFTAGAIDHAVHTRQVGDLGGLLRKMPLTAAGALLAGISLAGLPPGFGFIAKELVYETTLAGIAALALSSIMVILLALVTASGAWAFLHPFIGRESNAATSAHDGDSRMWAPPLVLGVLGVLAGLFAGSAGAWLIAPAVNATLGEPYTIKLALWHGWTPMLVMSAATLAAAAIVYLARTRVQPWMARVWGLLHRIGPEAAYDNGLTGLKRAAAWQTRVLQNGYLRIYLLVIIISVIALAGYMFFARSAGISIFALEGVRIYDVALGVIIIASVVAVVRASSRLATIAILGVIGFSIALIYLLFGAPDLAMVQFAIETLSVILFILVIYRLPKFTRISAAPARLLDVLVALAGGVMMTVFVLEAAAQVPLGQVSGYYVENSLPAAQGRNIVNVILVDFRGLDTLGEITVLALAAIGVFALLHYGKAKQPENGGGP